MRNINVITDGTNTNTTIFDRQSGERIVQAYRLETVFDSKEFMSLGKLFVHGQEEPEDVRVWFDTDLEFIKHV